MLAFGARILLVLLLMASIGRPAYAEPPASINTPIRHEIAGTGSGGLDGLLKRRNRRPRW